MSSRRDPGMRHLSVVVLSAIVAGIAAYPSPSYAIRFHRSASDECHNVATNSTEGASGEFYIRCPFMDNDNFQHSQATHVYIYSHQEYADYWQHGRACVTFAGANGGACGNWSTTQGTAGYHVF